jgi:hypothetical protein
MHRLVLLLLLLSTPVLAAPFQETQVLNRGVPTGNPLDKSAFPVTPMALVGVTRYRVSLCPAANQAFNGGSIRLFIYNQVTQRWSFDGDMDVYPVTGVPNACVHKGIVNDVRVGFLYPSTQNVTLSSGTTVTIRVEPDSYGL